MFSMIAGLSRGDEELLRLLEQTLECADIYLLARKRQKGCDGMGDLAMVREEFEDSLEGLMSCCKRKGYMAGDFQCDMDSAADELCNLAVRKLSQQNSD
jgi:hypothetical protein